MGAAHTGGACPTLKEAIGSRADYNHTHLGWNWFRDRGFKKQKHYGCRKPSYEAGKEPQFNFALDCECPAWSQCTGDPFEYDHNNDGQTNISHLGECGCCSWWLIILIIIFSFAILGCILQWKWFRDRYRDYVKDRRRKKAGRYKEDDEQGDFSELHEKGGEDNRLDEDSQHGGRRPGSRSKGSRTSQSTRTSDNRARGRHEIGDDPSAGDSRPTSAAKVNRSQGGTVTNRSSRALRIMPDGDDGRSGVEAHRISPGEATRPKTPPLPPGFKKSLQKPAAKKSARTTQLLPDVRIKSGSDPGGLVPTFRASESPMHTLSEESLSMPGPNELQNPGGTPNSSSFVSAGHRRQASQGSWGSNQSAGQVGGGRSNLLVSLSPGATPTNADLGHVDTAVYADVQRDSRYEGQ